LRSLVGQLDTFTRDLDYQTPEIIAATESLNQLAGKFAVRQPVLDRALETIPAALQELDRQKDDLIDAADQFAKFSALTVDTINQTKENLVAQLTQVGPVLESLADAGPSLTRALSCSRPIPSPTRPSRTGQRGDYANLTAIIDLTLSRIDAGLFHRYAVGRRPHRARNAMGQNDRAIPEPLHLGQSACRALPLGSGTLDAPSPKNQDPADRVRVHRIDGGLHHGRCTS
jgi:ABC-type transporter Mla subunit MlaD